MKEFRNKLDKDEIKRFGKEVRASMRQYLTQYLFVPADSEEARRLGFQAQSRR